MMTLFKQYIQEGKISNAVLTGRNAFNKRPYDGEIFVDYYNFLCTISEKTPALSDKREFAGLAEVALAFYSENAELDDEVITKIESYQQKLNGILQNIEAAENKNEKRLIDDIQAQNEACLQDLIRKKDTLHCAKTQEQLDKALADVSTIESEINKNVLSDEQSKQYDKLTKEYTELISKKMREIEQINNIEYNKQAVNSFSKAFMLFREDVAKYKNQNQLFSLASSSLFKYDASRLFNETLIYYNHIYSFIFSKLEDDGRLALTRFSIECERNLV